MADTSQGVAFSCGCVFWYSRQVEQCSTVFSISIFISLFSSWLCHDSQSAMNSSGPGLYSILYCCMHRIMCSKHCDNVAASLPITDTNSLCSMMTLLCVQNQTSPAHARSWVLLSVLLYCYSALNRLLLAEHCTVWCFIISTTWVIPYLQ